MGAADLYGTLCARPSQDGRNEQQTTSLVPAAKLGASLDRDLPYTILMGWMGGAVDGLVAASSIALGRRIARNHHGTLPGSANEAACKDRTEVHPACDQARTLINGTGGNALPLLGDVTLRGLNFFWSRDIEVRGVNATGIRHGIQFSQGNSYFLVDGFDSASSFDDGLDCHGARNQHGTLSNFSVATSCKIGNTSYAGDQDIALINGTCQESLKIQGGSQVDATNVNAQNLLLQTIAGYPKYYPQDCTYTNCSFNNTETSESNNCLYLDCDEGTADLPVFRQATNQRFYGCNFNQYRDGGGNWAVFFTAIDNPCDFSFYDCTLTSAAPQSPVEQQYVEVIHGGPGPQKRLVLNFKGCSFVSSQSAEFAITLKAGSYAGVALVSCSFTSDFSVPMFISGIGPTVSQDANVDNTINP